MRAHLRKWNDLFLKNTGLSPYVWIFFYILPFYFIFRTSSTWQAAAGIGMVILFFVCYLLSFVSRGRWPTYVWTGVQIVISTAMGYLFGYIYFSIFLAYFIGNLRNKAAFLTIYIIHLASTSGVAYYWFAQQDPDFIRQLPFVVLCLFGVILLPVSTYDKNRSDRLLGQLQDANKRINELIKLEERQRIARDLHDTLGQKLSMIGLKSELARKLVETRPKQAQAEMREVQEIARTALKEVRHMVTEMRGAKLEEELSRAREMMEAAEIQFRVEGEERLKELHQLPPLHEHVICMCLREAMTNIVKHSGASECAVALDGGPAEVTVRVRDNGAGFDPADAFSRGSGLKGMKERLEFINGSLEIVSGKAAGEGDKDRTGEKGTEIVIRVPVMRMPQGQGSDGKEPGIQVPEREVGQ